MPYHLEIQLRKVKRCLWITQIIAIDRDDISRTNVDRLQQFDGEPIFVLYNGSSHYQGLYFLDGYDGFAVMKFLKEPQLGVFFLTTDHFFCGDSISLVDPPERFNWDLWFYFLALFAVPSHKQTKITCSTVRKKLRAGVLGMMFPAADAQPVFHHPHLARRSVDGLADQSGSMPPPVAGESRLRYRPTPPGDWVLASV